MACGDGGLLCFASDTLAKDNHHAIVDCCNLRRASYRHRFSTIAEPLHSNIRGGWWKSGPALRAEHSGDGARIACDRFHFATALWFPRGTSRVCGGEHRLGTHFCTRSGKHEREAKMGNVNCRGLRNGSLPSRWSTQLGRKPDHWNVRLFQ